MPNPLPVDISGEDITLNSQPPAAATGTPTSVAASATNVTVLAANTNRLGFSVYNDSTAILYLLVGQGTASATVYTAQVNPGALYEPPAGLRYTGIVQGAWVSATGNARVVEWSA